MTRNPVSRRNLPATGGVKLRKVIATSEEQLRSTENQLAPARKVVSAFVQSEVSAIDMKLRQLSERQRQLGRLHAALEIGNEFTSQIKALEKEIEPLQDAVVAIFSSWGQQWGQLSRCKKRGAFIISDITDIFDSR